MSGHGTERVLISLSFHSLKWLEEEREGGGEERWGENRNRER